MIYEIIQKGNRHTNSSSRDAHKPIVIVDHISAGSMGSMDNWFTSSGNKVSSAHFGVARDGRIHQYVPIERMAWTQGLTADRIPFATASIIREHYGVNPNKYCIGIEHEGNDGDLTEAQFAATVWLHKYIQAEVLRIYGHKIELTPRYVIGHFQVDPKRKPNCPGPKFPWARLYAELAREVAAVAPPTATPVPEAGLPKSVQIKVNGAAIRTPETGRLFGGQVYGALAVMGGIFGVPIKWDNETKEASFNGKVIESAQIYNGRAYIPVRTIAEAYGARVKWDGSGPIVDIIKGVK